MLAPGISTNLARFAIGFDHRDRERLHELWDRILDENRWSEGVLDPRVRGSAGLLWNGLDAVAFNGWTGAALAALEWAGVRGETVLCPSNTFMATPLARSRREHVEFVDCNRDDLCMSFDDLERKVRQHSPRAVFLVHIGGHIAFEVERIAELCDAEGIFLIEDCAHAHGASWHDARPGTWGTPALVVLRDQDDLDG